MDDQASPSPQGISRRSALQAAAWSVPVIAATITLPRAAAASPWIDLTLSARPATDELTAVRPDGLQQYTLALPTTFDLYSPAPLTSATIELGFDNRVLGNPTVEVSRAPAQLLTLKDFGVITMAAFNVAALNGNHVMSVSFGTINRGVWYWDIRPYVIYASVSGGATDPEIDNDDVVIRAVYSATTAG